MKFISKMIWWRLEFSYFDWNINHKLQNYFPQQKKLNMTPINIICTHHSITIIVQSKKKRVDITMIDLHFNDSYYKSIYFFVDSREQSRLDYVVSSIYILYKQGMERGKPICHFMWILMDLVNLCVFFLSV